MFKIGDWVAVNGHTQQILEFINEDSYGKTDMVELTNDYVHVEELRPWRPQVGEWCWFYDHRDEIPALGQFKKQINGYHSSAFGGSICHFCEPFIGELPSFIKE